MEYLRCALTIQARLISNSLNTKFHIWAYNVGSEIGAGLGGTDFA